MILLHPFFPRFLEHTGVIAVGTSVISAFARPRATALLHFLATGREEIFEYELGLIKVLLGLDPETPLPVSAGYLQPEDVAEAEALLQSVIEHWRALKNTSIRVCAQLFYNVRVYCVNMNKVGSCRWNAGLLICCWSNCHGASVSSNCRG